MIAQLHSVNDECARIHGVLERVSGLIAPPPSPPQPSPRRPRRAAGDRPRRPAPSPPPPPPAPEPPPPPPRRSSPAAPPAPEPPPPPPAPEPPPPPAEPPPPDPYGPPPGEPDEPSPIAVPSGQFVGRLTPAPVAYEGTGGDPDAPPSEGIRLLATQMAVAGETVGDIERRLRTDFGVTNAAQVVRELFGPSGDPL